jgi:tetrahydromethanopterin S-methyltransferase subunit D
MEDQSSSLIKLSLVLLVGSLIYIFKVTEVKRFKQN